MTTANSIFLIKVTHSLGWAVLASAVLYTFYSGVSGDINQLTYIAIASIFLETIVLLLNKWACPLTILAKKVKPDWQDGDDIFLPTWLAVHNKLIFGTLFFIGILLVGLRLFVD